MWDSKCGKQTPDTVFHVVSIRLQYNPNLTKEPYKTDDILQKRPVILRSLLIVATPEKKSRPPTFLSHAYH